MTAPVPMASLPPLIRSALALWRENRRLRWLFALTFSVLLADGCLRWLDWFGAAQAQKVKLEARLSQLDAQSRDLTALRSTLRAAQDLEKQAKARLLTTRSEAVAQAKLQDWLLDVAVKNRLVLQALTVGAARPAADSKTERPDERQSKTSDGLMELPVSLSILMTPDAVVAALQALEEGPWWLRVQSFSIRTAERRIELGIVVPLRIGPEGAK